MNYASIIKHTLQVAKEELEKQKELKNYSCILSLMNEIQELELQLSIMEEINNED